MEVSKPHNHKGHRCCCRPSPACTSGVVFSIVAIIDLVRIIAGWQIIVNGHEIPIWASVICVLISASLAGWNFWYGCCKKCRDGNCSSPEHKGPQKF